MLADSRAFSMALLARKNSNPTAGSASTSSSLLRMVMSFGKRYHRHLLVLVLKSLVSPGPPLKTPPTPLPVAGLLARNDRGGRGRLACRPNLAGETTRIVALRSGAAWPVPLAGTAYAGLGAMAPGALAMPAPVLKNATTCVGSAPAPPCS